MALSIVHFARWLAWQLGDPGQPEPTQPASITVFSSRRQRPEPPQA